MADKCCSAGCAEDISVADARFRRVLWIALAVNAAMFAIELAGGIWSGSVSLLADSMDFFADAANYGVTLFVLPLGLGWRARAALAKGLTMGGYGLFVLSAAAIHAMQGGVPEAASMGAIGFVALCANVAVAAMLYRHRDEDANRQSVWLCSRNDAIGNVAVMLAALGVFGTGTGWPDLAVAVVIGGLGVGSALVVMRRSTAELHAARRARVEVQAQPVMFRQR